MATKKTNQQRGAQQQQRGKTADERRDKAQHQPHAGGQHAQKRNDPRENEIDVGEQEDVNDRFMEEELDEEQEGSSEPDEKT